MRKPILAGNWKMNKTATEAVEFVNELKEKVGEVKEREVLVCPVFTALKPVSDVIKGTSIKLGAQNMHWEDGGAFTGEISAEMLLTSGCTYVILGHSERRAIFSEDDKLVNSKALKALKAGLIPIVCVGETLAERESGAMKKVIEEQITGSLDSFSKSDMEKTVIAYEPVWAIGTGKMATPQQAEEVHIYIRSLLADKYGEETAENVTILYGGSVKSSNAEGLFSLDNIDGALIGGASLKAEEFVAIARAMK